MKHQKKVIAFTLALIIVLGILFSFPITATSTAGNYDWEANFNPEVSKLSVSPNTGTFIIENTDYAYAEFNRRIDIESVDTYQVSVEIKLENFQLDPDDPEDWTKLVVNDDDRWFHSGTNLPTNEWTSVSVIFTANDNDTLNLALRLRGKGKATFRNLKLEKMSSNNPMEAIDDTVTVSQNKMIPRNYNVRNDSEWAQTARNIDIKDFNLPDAIGRTTLTYDSAFALVGKDPKEIAAQVKTVGDVLQYHKFRSCVRNMV